MRTGLAAQHTCRRKKNVYLSKYDDDNDDIVSVYYVGRDWD